MLFRVGTQHDLLPASEPPGNPGAFFRRSRITTVHSSHFLVQLSRCARGAPAESIRPLFPPTATGGRGTRRAPRLRCAHTRTPTLTTHRTHRQTHAKRLYYKRPASSGTARTTYVSTCGVRVARRLGRYGFDGRLLSPEHYNTPVVCRRAVDTPAGWAAAGSCAPIKDLFERGHTS